VSYVTLLSRVPDFALGTREPGRENLLTLLFNELLNRRRHCENQGRENQGRENHYFVLQVLPQSVFNLFELFIRGGCENRGRENRI
jgi:hypothetical protein